MSLDNPTDTDAPDDSEPAFDYGKAAVTLSDYATHDDLEPGTLYHAQVNNVEPFGVFVTLSKGGPEWQGRNAEGQRDALSGLINQPGIPRPYSPSDFTVGDALVVKLWKWVDEGVALRLVEAANTVADIDVPPQWGLVRSPAERENDTSVAKANPSLGLTHDPELLTTLGDKVDKRVLTQLAKNGDDEDADADEEAGAFECGECGETFETEAGRNGHKSTHARADTTSGRVAGIGAGTYAHAALSWLAAFASEDDPRTSVEVVDGSFFESSTAAASPLNKLWKQGLVERVDADRSGKHGNLKYAYYPAEDAGETLRALGGMWPGNASRQPRFQDAPDRIEAGSNHHAILAGLAHAHLPAPATAAADHVAISAHDASRRAHTLVERELAFRHKGDDDRRYQYVLTGLGYAALDAHPDYADATPHDGPVERHGALDAAAEPDTPDAADGDDHWLDGEENVYTAVVGAGTDEDETLDDIVFSAVQDAVDATSIRDAAHDGAANALDAADLQTSGGASLPAIVRAVTESVEDALADADLGDSAPGDADIPQDLRVMLDSGTVTGWRPVESGDGTVSLRVDLSFDGA